MKTNAQCRRHVKAWYESDLSQADYCRQQDVNPKTFSRWVKLVLARDKDIPLEVIPIQVMQSTPDVTTPVKIMLRLEQGAHLELTTAVSPRWLAELLKCLA
jgi:hypothetical protein